MDWKPRIDKNQAPLFMALVQAIADDIKYGILSSGIRLPTHRELADDLKMAVGTVTRAYDEAERRGLIYGDGRRGTFVGEMPSGRRLLASISRGFPTGIDLSKNHPAHAFDPDLASALRSIARKPECQRLLQYPPAAGMQEHRVAGAKWIESLGLKVEPDSLFLCGGAQHALMVVFAAETHPGDTVACEEYTYPGVKAIAETLGLELLGIPMDDEGIIPDILEHQCKHKSIRLLYCNPSLQNPTNRIFTSARRRQIAAIAERYDFEVVEDEILSPLLDEQPDFISGFAPERTYFVISASKAIAAGLRLGFIVAPQSSRQKLSDSLQASNLGGPPLMAEIFKQWLDSGIIGKTVARRKRELAAMNRITEEELKNFNLHTVNNGYHVWLQLPESWAGVKFTMEAQKKGVMVAPAEIFAVDKKAALNLVRLSIGAISDQEQLKRGLEILTRILSDTMPRDAVTV